MLEQYTSAIVVRDPLQRMISQYLHWDRKKGDTYWRNSTDYNKSMKFSEYAFLQHNQNFQNQALGGKKIENIDIIGTTKNLSQVAQKLELIQSGETIPTLNKKPEWQSLHEDLSSNFRDKFKDFHSKDYDLYEYVQDHE